MDELPWEDGERHSDGVRTRADGKGDGWAGYHREKLGNGWYMNDVDVLFGCEVWGKNTGEKLFAEYVPDDASNAKSAIRAFGMVAMFDRKRSESAMRHSRSHLSRKFYLWLCRCIASHQGMPPRFFYVIGGDNPPWSMYEVDIYSGQFVNDGDPCILHGDGWASLWERLGLRELRDELREKVQS